MNQNEIREVYRKLGLGTEQEREALLVQWNAFQEKTANEFIFIQAQPTSGNQVSENAQLA